MRQGTGEMQFLASNHLGSAETVFNALGTVSASMRYNPFGGTRYESPAFPSMNQFTGQRKVEIGLIYFNARWLDIQISHFTQSDTIIPNPYNPQDWDHVRNNPINYNDLSGHYAVCDNGKCGATPRNKTPSADEQMIDFLSKNNVTGHKSVSTHLGDPNTFHDQPGDPYPIQDKSETDEAYHLRIKGWIERYGIHPGVDIDGSEGDNLYAAYDGTVVYVGEPRNGHAPGYVVIIEHNIDGQKYYACYFHVSTNEKNGTPPPLGSQVKAGDVIGPMGKSGTFSVDLHFEVRRSFPTWGHDDFWPLSRKAFDAKWLDISPAFEGPGWGWDYLDQ